MNTKTRHEWRRDLSDGLYLAQVVFVVALVLMLTGSVRFVTGEVAGIPDTALSLMGVVVWLLTAYALTVGVML